MTSSSQAYQAHQLSVDPKIVRVEVKDIRYPVRNLGPNCSIATDYASIRHPWIRPVPMP